MECVVAVNVNVSMVRVVVFLYQISAEHISNNLNLSVARFFSSAIICVYIVYFATFCGVVLS